MIKASETALFWVVVVFLAFACTDSEPPEDDPQMAELAEVPLGELVWEYQVASDREAFLQQNLIYPPKVVGGVVLVPAADGSVHAVSASDGEPLWVYHTEASDGPKTLQPLKALKVVDGKALIVAETHIHAVDAATGEPLWLFPGVFHHPPAVGDHLLFAPRFGVKAVDIDDGSRVWSHSADGLTRHAPMVDEGVVYYADRGQMYARDALTGEAQWQRDIGINMDVSPVASHGRIYAKNFENDVFALEPSTGEAVWHTQFPGTSSDLFEVVDDLLYLSVNRIYALDVASGEEAWSFSAEGNGPFTSVYLGWTEQETYFVVDGGVVYFGTAIGEVLAVDAASGELIWSHQTIFELPAAPTVSGGRVYLGSLGAGLWVLDAANGELLWLYPTDAAVLSSPIVAGDTVIVASADGRLHAVRAPS